MKGTYTLLLACNRSFKLKIGRVGEAQVEKGYYLYTGSALGQGSVSLEGRVARHFRRNKRVKWHVDFLTVRTETTIAHAIALRSDKRLECEINRQIISRLDAEPIVPRAGATDCACKAHLLAVKSHVSPKIILKKLLDVYQSFGKPLLFW